MGDQCYLWFHSRALPPSISITVTDPSDVNVLIRFDNSGTNFSVELSDSTGEDIGESEVMLKLWLSKEEGRGKFQGGGVISYLSGPTW